MQATGNSAGLLAVDVAIVAAVTGAGAPPGSSYRSNRTAQPAPAAMFFGSGVRQAIMTGGRTQRMIEITYDGYRRLVEPYRLAYYRRMDGVAQEYFWGFDTTGGKSRQLSMKSFFSDKIRDARVTEHGYSPRYPVEF